MSPRARDVLGLVGWLAVSFLPSLAGTFFMPGRWYAELDKPAWTPPPWVFGPAWTLLYASMGVAAWLVWRRAGFTKGRTALTLFGGQLVLNALWSPVFFGAQAPLPGLFVIVALWAAILATLIAFARHHTWAAVLLVPYLGWVSFATALNFALWQMNP